MDHREFILRSEVARDYPVNRSGRRWSFCTEIEGEGPASERMIAVHISLSSLRAHQVIQAEETAARQVQLIPG